MRYSTFSKINNNALREPMFLGNNVNISRYDQQKFDIFEKLIEQQLSYFWRPEEVNLAKDRLDFLSLSPNEVHIFMSNLKYQILLDSIQGRSPSVALLPIVSLPELETWIETWSFYETIHSRSYTHIIQNLVNEPSIIFDDIVTNEEIIKRAVDISKYYDNLISYVQYYQSMGPGVYKIDNKTINVNLREIKKLLYLAMHSINALEAIRFYVSFACTFSFSERNLMEGSGKILRFIARDENLHLSGTQHIINIWRDGRDDLEMQDIAKELEGEVTQIFLDAVEQEKNWAKYLFAKGSVLGLNAQILCEYIDHIAEVRMKSIGLKTPLQPKKNNPIPWINHYLISENVQVAPQEVEISSYLVDQIDTTISENDLKNLSI